MERNDAETVADILIAVWRRQPPQNAAIWSACLQLDKLLRNHISLEAINRAKRAPKKHRGAITENIIQLYMQQVDAEPLINVILERKTQRPTHQSTFTVLGAGTHRLSTHSRITRITAAGRLKGAQPDQLEVVFQASEPYSYHVSVRFIPAGGTAGKLGESLVSIDQRLFLEHTLDFHLYSELLTNALFNSPELQSAWSYALGYRAAKHGLLGVQLRFSAGAEQLHTLRWEQLLDPSSREPIALNERVMLHRVIEGAEPSPAGPAQPLSVLAVVSAPHDTLSFRLPLLDSAVEERLINECFYGVPTVVLARDAGRPATPEALAFQLCQSPTILYIVAHGSFCGNEAYIWLEDTTGRSNRITAAELGSSINALAQRPSLAVLVSCQSAGTSHYENTFAALGPTLVRAGIAAVIGMQGNLSVEAAHRMLPVLFKVLCRGEDLGHAVAAARRQGGSDWWLPVLFLHDGPVPLIAAALEI